MDGANNGSSETKAISFSLNIKYIEVDSYEHCGHIIVEHVISTTKAKECKNTDIRLLTSTLG
jgi:hypothetical protein